MLFNVRMWHIPQGIWIIRSTHTNKSYTSRYSHVPTNRNLWDFKGFKLLINENEITLHVSVQQYDFKSNINQLFLLATSQNKATKRKKRYSYTKIKGKRTYCNRITSETQFSTIGISRTFLAVAFNCCWRSCGVSTVAIVG